MKVTSINDTIHAAKEPRAIRVEGSFIIFSYGDVDVYYNDAGRELFKVTLDSPPPPPQLSRFGRFWIWLTTVQE